MKISQYTIAAIGLISIALYAALPEQDNNTIATLLVAFKEYPQAFPSSDSAKNHIISKLLLRKPKEKLNNTTEPEAINPMENNLTSIENSINELEDLHQGYSYLNPYRYILGNKIESLKKLAVQLKNNSHDETLLKQAEDALKNLSSWVKK